MIEEWRDIEGYEGYYQVSSLGRIRSLDRLIDFWNRWLGEKVKRIRKGRVMKPGSNPNGYKIATLNKEAKIKYYSVHRLVANAFIENIDNLPQINHKDCDKTNNCVNNLEWCTPSENLLHAHKNGLITINNQFTKKYV